MHSIIRKSALVLCLSGLFTVVCTTPAVRAERAADAELTALGERYPTEIRPLLLRYCHECHSGDRLEAEIDLSAFPTLAEVRKRPRVWQKVGEMLDTAQMPPKKAPQPTDAERTKLQTWVRGYLTAEVRDRAGDPGRVVLRRLSNAEYTYTLRDLTGVDTLQPAREFPVDGAAGEGFTNTGNALVMSPALITKYLDAAKEIADHAVLLPDGFRFSPSTTESDWTNETLDKIRTFYRQFTDARGGDKVNLQGIVFDTNQGGRLPVEKYFAATLSERETLASGAKTPAQVAAERGLNSKYLTMLWASLSSTQPSPLLDPLRQRWRLSKPEDAESLAADVATWQKGLWRFTTVGHIGKVGGPTSWLEPLSPMSARQDVRYKLPTSANGQDVTVSLAAADAGDGNQHDYVIWQQPRLFAPGRPDLPLKDVRRVVQSLEAMRARVFADTSKYLGAAAEATASQGTSDVAKLSEKHAVDADTLRRWLDLLGVLVESGKVELKGHFTTKMNNVAGYAFIQGWGSDATPLIVTNSSDQHVRIPGNMPGHSVAVHPSPTLRAAVGWQSPIAGKLRIEPRVKHAHPECGNGVTWLLEVRRGSNRQTLATGVAQGNNETKIVPVENVNVRPGDVVSLLVGPRGNNHSCDLTTVDLKLIDTEDGGKTWSLSEEISSDVQAGNPHVDRQGHAGVWHFYTEPDKEGAAAVAAIPPGSLLAKWQAASDASEKQKLADSLQKLVLSKADGLADGPDVTLYRQLASLSGPLFRGALAALPKSDGALPPADAQSQWGVDPALFGRHPLGRPLDAASLCVQAPAVIDIRLPADLAEGCELVTTGVLDSAASAEGSVQLEVIAGKAAPRSGLRPSEVIPAAAKGRWTDGPAPGTHAAPILVAEESAARQRMEAALDEYRNLFPAALCYTKIVPVDEVVTLTLYYREDHHLVRLMLDDAQRAELDRLWDQLHYISHDAPKLVDALAQLIEFATQDANPKVFEPLREPFAERAAAYRRRLVETEPEHVDALVEFAAQAFRRPLADPEIQQLRGLYARLRQEELAHDDAFRLTLARVLVAPAFLYKIEKPAPGVTQAPVNDWELASRLSYFLWSSQPDTELLKVAATRQLQTPEALLAQTRRMLYDPRTRRLATEFACQWLHINDFESLDEKSEGHFPTFAGLRGAMFEESARFFTDLFQNNGSVLQILDADHTFLNEDLAKHYGISGISGPEWRRVDGIHKFSRGGILGQATTLSKQSGASRTSPILRGNWISEVLLGERLPRPPKDVPQLPDDEAALAGLTVRQLVEKHSSDPKCAVCHQRIDAYGFSLEAFDAIGRWREKDLGDRPINTRVKAMDGAQFEGLAGLRGYLLSVRRDAFVKQFCRKLLGFALGREVQLSDQPLLAEMQSELKAKDYRVLVAIEMIVKSKQFREIRGKDAVSDEE